MNWPLFFVLADQKTPTIAYVWIIWYQCSSKHIAHGGENDFTLSAMRGRFRILTSAALNEKDKEQSQTFHSFSVVQQGFESPATLRLKATSGLTSS